ncbi:MAG TPA: hypothetical protein VLJ37_05185 [bacterium]|nr:hypothetical protein [bacterium]
MFRLRNQALTLVAAVFLTGLWVHQLPESRVERVLSAVFRPFQRVMFTNRFFRMYAPDPRSRKRIPAILLKTEAAPVRFFKPGLSIFPREKWSNFMDHLGKALDGETFFFSPEEGGAIFRRLAARLCREASVPGDRVLSVTFQSRSVSYGEIQGDIVWDEPEVLEGFACP